MKYLIDEAIVRALLDYLGSRPYDEVWQGIQALHQLEPAVPTDEETA